MENHRTVAAVGEADVGVDGMHCSFHPFNAAGGGGGICAFCLQEKLGKLVSSSLAFPSQRNSSSPSASPSFRSDDVVPSTVSFASSSSMPRQGHDEHHAKQSKVASFLAKKKKKKGTVVVEEEEAPSMVFQRSRSIAFSAATPQSCHFYDVGGQVYSPRKRGGFWSFISLSSSSSSSRPHNARDRDSGHSLSRIGQAVVEEDNVVVSANNGVSASSFESHKVSRSRSVGCGSRSFSGDFFERISTGFIGDCTTLRRVESHREGKPPRASTSTTSEAHHHPHQCMKERVRCGGIFGGFAIPNTTNSSSSISSSSACSSSYWVSSSSNSAEDNVNHSGLGASSKPTVYSHHHGRSKSWGWALASPMRAFSRPSSGKRNAGAAIKPTSGMNGASLLAVGG